MSEYVVQRADAWDFEPEDAREVWTDIATVSVPAKTHRRTAIVRALEQAEISLAPDGPPLKLRVLDAESARVISVTAKQPSPRLVIGEPDA